MQVQSLIGCCLQLFFYLIQMCPETVNNKKLALVEEIGSIMAKPSDDEKRGRDALELWAQFNGGFDIQILLRSLKKLLRNDIYNDVWKIVSRS